MARRIVEAYLCEALYAADRENDEQKYGSLKIDQRVTFEWFKDNNGMQCRVLNVGICHPIRGSSIGQLTNSDDVKWFGKLNSEVYIARIHNSGQFDHGLGGRVYEIEVLTGQDYNLLLTEQQQNEWLGFIKHHWWQIGLAFLVLYWWVS